MPSAEALVPSAEVLVPSVEVSVCICSFCLSVLCASGALSNNNEV